jgi:hypothetical protein
MAHDSGKRIHRLTASFSDSEMADLAMLADADNRPVSEMLWVMVRRSMYGIVGRAGADVDDNRCGDVQRCAAQRCAGVRGA